MSRHSRLTVLAVAVSILALTAPIDLLAQGRGGRRPPPPPRSSVAVRGQVFIGGYFYDPYFGPYPWWVRTQYPWYYPVYDQRADLKIDLEPDEAAVYVDGYYAGIVDDFDGVFQGLWLSPGGHNVVIYLDGYRTVHHNIYLRPASTFKLKGTLVLLAPGERSEPPPVAPPIPPPPAGSYQTSPRPAPVAPPDTAPHAVGFGTLDVRVSPPEAELFIDGKRWDTSEPGHFVVQVPEGPHRIEVKRPGFRTYAAELEVREGQTLPLNVSLSST